MNAPVDAHTGVRYYYEEFGQVNAQRYALGVSGCSRPLPARECWLYGCVQFVYRMLLIFLAMVH